MRIDLDGVQQESRAQLRDYVQERMGAAIGRFRGHVQWARVKVADVQHGEGSQDKRCVVQLRLRNLPDVVFAITQFEVKAAVDQAAERLTRVLSQRLRRVRPTVSLQAQGV
jgi:putative sigma-54 modulation protein